MCMIIVSTMKFFIIKNTDKRLFSSELAETGKRLFRFALEAGDHQPSGTSNYSRFDTSELDLDYLSNETDMPDLDHLLNETDMVTIKMYQKNYSPYNSFYGLGGLAYST